MRGAAPTESQNGKLNSESARLRLPQPNELLGEMRASNCLTIRTAVIGRDFTKNAGPLEWFISQRGKSVKGYVNSIYSRFSTQALAEILAYVVELQS
jgi:hypothetical protein